MTLGNTTPWESILNDSFFLNFLGPLLREDHEYLTRISFQFRNRVYSVIRWTLVIRPVFSSWSKYMGSPQTMPFHSNPFSVKLTWYTVEESWIHMHAGQKHSSSPSWNWHLTHYLSPWSGLFGFPSVDIVAMDVGAQYYVS